MEATRIPILPADLVIFAYCRTKMPRVVVRVSFFGGIGAGRTRMTLKVNQIVRGMPSLQDRIGGSFLLLSLPQNVFA